MGLINMDFSYSAAIGLFKNLVGLTLLLLTNALSKRSDTAVIGGL